MAHPSCNINDHRGHAKFRVCLLFAALFLVPSLIPILSLPITSLPNPSSFSLLAILIIFFLSYLILFFFRTNVFPSIPKQCSCYLGVMDLGGGMMSGAEGGGGRGGGGKGGSGGSDKVQALFVRREKSSVIRYLNPNQQFHIRNPSRMFLHLIAVPLSFCTD